MIRCRQKGIDIDCAVARSGQCVTRKSCAVLKLGWGSHEHVQVCVCCVEAKQDVRDLGFVCCWNLQF